MAVELNREFERIMKDYGARYPEIVVGVFTGKQEGLTDKYDILRGINRGKSHQVVDLTDKVKVYAGRDFWTWLNHGESRTQDWVLEGILQGLKAADCSNTCRKLLESYKKSFAATYATHVRKDGTIDWEGLLTSING
jgi:hypothetical protein